MKKGICLLLTCIVGLGFPLTAMAYTEEEESYIQKLEELEKKYSQAKESIEPDVYTLLNDQLPKEDYGAMYEEDGVATRFDLIQKEYNIDVYTKWLDLSFMKGSHKGLFLFPKNVLY